MSAAVGPPRDGLEARCQLAPRLQSVKRSSGQAVTRSPGLRRDPPTLRQSVTNCCDFAFAKRAATFSQSTMFQTALT
ncbi:hypothetical protein SAMN02800687_2383 [Curtobacterium sp. UNCCL20]|nr:hypothetical protein SAMN02800687_2383 [Curtobacterium sp. UNCCL20]